MHFTSSMLLGLAGVGLSQAQRDNGDASYDFVGCKNLAAKGEALNSFTKIGTFEGLTLGICVKACGTRSVALLGDDCWCCDEDVDVDVSDYTKNEQAADGTGKNVCKTDQYAIYKQNSDKNNGDNRDNRTDNSINDSQNPTNNTTKTDNSVNDSGNDIDTKTNTDNSKNAKDSFNTKTNTDNSKNAKDSLNGNGSQNGNEIDNSVNIDKSKGKHIHKEANGNTAIEVANSTDTAIGNEANGNIAATNSFNSVNIGKIVCYGDYCAPLAHCEGPHCDNYRVVCEEKECHAEKCDKHEEWNRLVKCDGESCHYSNCKGEDCKKKIVCEDGHCKHEECHGEECEKKFVCKDDKCDHEKCHGDECHRKYVCTDECKPCPPCHGDECPPPPPPCPECRPPPPCHGEHCPPPPCYGEHCPPPPCKDCPPPPPPPCKDCEYPKTGGNVSPMGSNSGSNSGAMSGGEVSPNRPATTGSGAKPGYTPSVVVSGAEKVAPFGLFAAGVMAILAL